ncbi:unannotated protein [freshwater metagenome]|uniref:Unannotated protein n=1 Tax=freshwater metagenome TaxID=449393 RepID=A0A6J7A557_9ZZZZ
MLLQQRLDLIVGEVRAGVEQQRSSAGHDCGGLRRTAATEQRAADVALWVFHVDAAVRNSQAVDVCAGGDDVRVAGAVTAGCPRRNRELLVTGGLNSADSDHVGIHGRAGEAARVVAVVAGGDNHHDAGLPRPLERVGQRIGGVRQRRATAVGEVEHPDLQIGGVLDDPVDASDDLRDIGGASVVANLDRHDACARSNTFEPLRVLLGELRVRARSVSGDDAGDVRAVAEVVVVGGLGDTGFGGEVDQGNHLGVVRKSRNGGDTGVDDSNVDAFAGIALVPEIACADLVDDVVHRAERQPGAGPVGVCLLSGSGAEANGGQQYCPQGSQPVVSCEPWCVHPGISLRCSARVIRLHGCTHIGLGGCFGPSRLELERESGTCSANLPQELTVRGVGRNFVVRARSERPLPGVAPIRPVPPVRSSAG